MQTASIKMDPSRLNSVYASFKWFCATFTWLAKKKKKKKICFIVVVRDFRVCRKWSQIGLV